MYVSVKKQKLFSNAKYSNNKNLNLRFLNILHKYFCILSTSAKNSNSLIRKTCKGC